MHTVRSVRLVRRLACQLVLKVIGRGNRYFGEAQLAWDRGHFP
jgi:hypothetical protein